MIRRFALWPMLLIGLSCAGCGRQIPGTDMGKVDSSEEQHSLVGKPAPQFTADLLGGGSITLGENPNKKVIILDFWATWCGPCVEALPTIAGVAKDSQSRGVELYAVNIKEDPDAVKEFLATNKLDVPVVMDRDGSIAELYNVEAIPQTVIIGKDGRIQVVHVGLSPDLKERLTRELDELVEGKDLVVAAE